LGEPRSARTSSGSAGSPRNGDRPRPRGSSPTPGHAPRRPLAARTSSSSPSGYGLSGPDRRVVAAEPTFEGFRRRAVRVFVRVQENGAERLGTASDRRLGGAPNKWRVQKSRASGGADGSGERAAGDGERHVNLLSGGSRASSPVSGQRGSCEPTPQAGSLMHLNPS
jgi:hypothetical protein